MLTILAFIVVIGVIIFVHELGHFLAARSVGIRVETFSLGYPPKMFGRKVGDTEYCISWIPLGGYVKMAGMIDESLEGASTITGAPWEFASKKTWQKLWVILAGVLMNLILAMLICIGVTAVKGVSEPAGPIVGGVSAGGPAEGAGLQRGDRILSIDGIALTTWDGLTDAVYPRPEQELALVYEREGVAQTIRLTTLRREIDVDGELREVGLIGVEPLLVFRPATFGEVLASGVRTPVFWIRQVVNSLVLLVTGRASVKDLGGPLLIAKMSGESARQGAGFFLTFIAFISVNIGCLNLLPVPALDGGHAMIILIEGAIRRELPTKVKLILQQAGMILLLGLVLFILWNDAKRIFDFAWLHKIF
jgi:regulator of sigma E protease